MELRKPTLEDVFLKLPVAEENQKQRKRPFNKFRFYS